jgi:glycosyltransferase involved in cell wall biosynthesis
VARLVWFKGLDTLIAAMALLPPEAVGVRLLIVGAGPLRDELAAQAATAGLADRVTFAGERGDVPDILAAADVFVLSSVSEGMPISILEAMASGLPTVATDVGGVRELVADGETGFVVPARDARAFAQPLARLCGDEGLRRRLGEAAQSRATAQFGGAAMAERTEAVYAQALRKRSPGPGRE